MNKWLFRRRMVQICALALLFVPVVMKEPFWFGTYLSSQFFSLSLTDPLAALEVFLAGKFFYLTLFYSAVPLILLGILSGRLFCGWVCPVNTLLEMAALLKKTRQKRKNSVSGMNNISGTNGVSGTNGLGVSGTNGVGGTNELGVSGKNSSYAPYLVLVAVLVVSALLSLPIFTIISPVGTLSRAAAFGLGIEFLLVAFIVIGEWVWGQKAWCRMVCPAGALYGLLGRLRPLRIRLSAQSCVDCGRCRNVCSMQVEPGSTQPLQVMNCVNCADCVDCCPQRALKFTFAFNRKGENFNHESAKSFTR